jgi:hypothetical protein
MILYFIKIVKSKFQMFFPIKNIRSVTYYLIISHASQNS